MNQPPSRLLTTSARVHPPYLPYLHNASRNRGKSLKWLPPLAAAVTAGLAVSRYRDSLTITTNTSTASASSPAAQQAEAEAERRRRHREQEAAMEDAYGDRGSLAELERALAVYEAQRRG
ncbi:predicted protein [Chaetomium globosum CBS 148.51]|uniref:Uncharacterized protein n=1 Tax=Chaetomium globosum (strain ATCC 6205 / CBS 148.51 / DSM 1962 / NBRC 6347 / NRRL 1970) TaxID=306901 RepID=Q2H1R1_CHAGB|nr:uncharacterized protein CHGG_04285 [Chaetomium globosum CBS 148.51]EAQ87666.1 predicted protein [Chaetomium globosum CBS 148.51]